VTRTDEREWAKEMVVEGIDRYLHELWNDPVNGAPDLDSQDALLKQRNRVARFLGLPEKAASDV
jgi:hypothetical protein